ncbi:MAG: HAD family hydrolase [Elainellaceae cyanobacterium]
MTGAISGIDGGSIDAVIFDLGGVILNISYQKTLVAFSALSGRDAASLYTQHRQADLFDAYEMGQITSQDFRQGLRSLLGLGSTVDDSTLDAAWNAMLLDLPAARLQTLAQLSERFRLFLLSNTNEIHKAAFEHHVKETLGSSSALADRFEAVYYSHLVGDRKPHPSLFQRVIDEQALTPSRTLFVDDTAGHLQGAQAVGLRTVHLSDGLTFEALSDSLLAPV